MLAGVDAAYSGDWSRTGVISKDFEDGLKPLVMALGLFHIGCATVAGRAAASKNLSVVPAVLKASILTHLRGGVCANMSLVLFQERMC